MDSFSSELKDCVHTGGPLRVSGEPRSGLWIRRSADLRLPAASPQTVIEALQYAVTGECPPNSGKGKAFVHDPKVCFSPPPRRCRCQGSTLFQGSCHRRRLKLLLSARRRPCLSVWALSCQQLPGLFPVSIFRVPGTPACVVSQQSRAIPMPASLSVTASRAARPLPAISRSPTTVRSRHSSACSGRRRRAASSTSSGRSSSLRRTRRSPSSSPSTTSSGTSTRRLERRAPQARPASAPPPLR